MSTQAQRLATADLEVIGRFTAASNATLLVRLLDRDSRSLARIAEESGHEPEIADLDPLDLAVYKPRDGERPLWDFPAGTLHRREVAAARVDAVMGAGLVPLTLLREDGPFGPGSLQRFVAHDPEEHYFTIRGPALDGTDPALRERLLLLASFDLVIDNADRKGGHVLVEQGDDVVAQRVRAVDHGVSFNVEPKHRTVIWDLASSPLSEGTRTALERLVAAFAGDFGHELAGLLSHEELDATRARAVGLLELGRMPEPEGPRPYPWPLL